MKNLFLALSLLSICACGKTPVSVDPALQPYFTSFETDVGSSTTGINAEFATNLENSPLGETVGECVIYTDGTRTIRIDSKYWAKADADSKTETIYHELGHCSMNLGHTSGYRANGCPVSIMNPYTFTNPGCFGSNKFYYFQELESLK